eukprot:gene38288-46525_t
MEVEESVSAGSGPSHSATSVGTSVVPPLSPSDAAWSLLDMTLDTFSSLCALQVEGSSLCVLLPLSLLQSLGTMRALLEAHMQELDGRNMLPRRAVRSLYAVEKVLECVNDLLAAWRSALEDKRPLAGAALPAEMLSPLKGHLAWQLEAVLSVSSVAQQGGGAGEAWRVLDAVGADLDGAQVSLKASVFNSAQCSLELLQAALHIAGLQSGGWLSAEDVRELAGQLVRWLQLPQLELLAVVVSNITALAALPLSPLFPANLHALLTNALLNKAATPQTFSLEAAAKTQASNVARSTLFCLDATVNSIVDMHSSDEAEYLAGFFKLKAGDKLTAIGQEMLSRYEAAKQHGMLSAEDVEKLEETLENLSNFIEYKQQFAGK